MLHECLASRTRVTLGSWSFNDDDDDLDQMILVISH